MSPIDCNTIRHWNVAENLQYYKFLKDKKQTQQLTLEEPLGLSESHTNFPQQHNNREDISPTFSKGKPGNPQLIFGRKIKIEEND